MKDSFNHKTYKEALKGLKYEVFLNPSWMPIPKNYKQCISKVEFVFQENINTNRCRDIFSKGGNNYLIIGEDERIAVLSFREKEKDPELELLDYNPAVEQDIP